MEEHVLQLELPRDQLALPATGTKALDRPGLVQELINAFGIRQKLMLDRLQRLGHHLKRPRNFQDSCLASPPIPRGGGGLLRVCDGICAICLHRTVCFARFRWFHWALP